jgi:hypothetical protein
MWQMRTERSRAWLVGFALTALAALATGCRERPASGAELRSALVGPTTAGQPFDPGALAGKVTLVNFWSPA